MSTEAVDHHRKAAEHFEHAAQHHSAAASHYGAGRYDQASREAYLAHGHYLHGSNHAAEAARGCIRGISDRSNTPKETAFTLSDWAHLTERRQLQCEYT